MTGRPLDAVDACEGAARTFAAVNGLLPPVLDAAALPADAWSASPGPPGGGWQRDPGDGPHGVLGIVRIGAGPGRLTLHDAWGLRAILPAGDARDARGAAAHAVDVLGRLDRALRRPKPTPPWRDWVAVGAELARADAVRAGRHAPASIRLATPWAPTAATDADGSTERGLAEAVGGRFDAACPVVLRTTLFEEGGRVRLIVVAAGERCAATDPVALLRAFATVRAAGGIA